MTSLASGRVPEVYGFQRSSRRLVMLADRDQRQGQVQGGGGPTQHGAAVSTGAGPVSVDRGLRRRRR